MMNGHVSQAEFDHVKGLVLRHDSQLSELTGVPEMVASVRAVQREMVDDQTRLRAIVDELAAWKEDSKVQFIHTLKGQLRGYEAKEEKRKEAIERDRLDLKRTIRGALIVGTITLLLGWGFAKLTAPPQVSPVTQGAK